jgi:predicted AlkP superfamily phosphohydrolase/phosphomutase/tetratricopeptide (TPR) repeat protein
MMHSTRVLVVGWDAADWKVIRPLLQRGEMPHLAGIMSEGVHGNLATLYPPFSPMLWTSIATGKRPPKHGILGFTEPTPDGARVRAVTNLGRKAKAIWNILHQQGKRSVVVNWWPSHPAEPIDGVMVSNRFAGLAHSPWPFPPLLPQTVHPPHWAENLAELRVHPTELEGEILRLFVPEMETVDQQNDKSLHSLAAMVAQTMSIHAAATEILANEAWDLAAVYFDGIDHASHRFMRFHPPRLPWVEESTFAIFKDVVANTYRHHDAMLGRLLELAGPEAHVMVLSDHGFHPDHLRTPATPPEAAGPAVEHRHFGMFCLKGPGIKKGETAYGASLLDITPTLLQLFGLPIGEDMDGKVLIGAFAEPPRIDTIPSWDQVPGAAGLHPPGMQVDPVGAAEAFKQMVDLGYIAPPAEDERVTVADSLFELRYNLARAHLDARQPELAEPILMGLHHEQPQDHRIVERLVQTLLGRGATTECRRLLDSFDAICEKTALTAGPELERRLKERPSEDLRPDRDQKDQRELFERDRLRAQATGHGLCRLLMRLRLAVASESREEAQTCLAQIGEGLPEQAVYGFSLHLAEANLRLGDTAAALRWCEAALELDAEDWQAWGVVAHVHFEAGRLEQAFDAAVESLSLVYHQPFLHYIAGKCLLVQRQWEEAEKALRVAVAQRPGFVAALLALAELCERAHNRLSEAAALRSRAQALQQPFMNSPGATTVQPTGCEPPPNGAPHFCRKETAPNPEQDIVIVSGLPRSGTSMMMQMLAAGGVNVWTDGLRQPDEDNPRGYFELVHATQLAQDHSWLPQARGRAVKIVAPLLPKLPPNEHYRIILMQRDPGALIASQHVMLERLGRNGAALDEAGLSATYNQWLHAVSGWMADRDQVAVLPCSYEEVLKDPVGVSRMIEAFLGRPFDCSRAAAAVDARLRHHGRT